MRMRSENKMAEQTNHEDADESDASYDADDGHGEIVPSEEENYMRQAVPLEDGTKTERNETQVIQQQLARAVRERQSGSSEEEPCVSQELQIGELKFTLSRGRTSTQMGSLLVPSYTLPREVRLVADIDVVLLHSSKDMVVPSGHPLGRGKSFEMNLSHSTMRFDAKIFLLDPPTFEV